jgi:hypothetical protein
MGDVVRPEFGQKRDGKRRREAEVVFQPLHVFGDAAGYRICLIRDAGGPEGNVLKVVAGQVRGCEYEPVATLPNTPAGWSEATTAGMAILRTLGMIESINNGPPL